MIAVRHLQKRLGSRLVLRDVNFEVRAGERFFVLGPSGSGKTTLLRILAGLSVPDAGEIRLGDSIVNSVPAHLRSTAMVFQHPALWPHLTVAENIGYGLEVRGIEPAERQRRIGAALELIQLGGMAERRPEELSGGQQQRVALARALVTRPQVLLLDEPLAHLDPCLRAELREALRQIQTTTRVTWVYVTHDPQDVLSLGDRAAVLHQGAVEQLGSPETLYRRPQTRFVAELLGDMNWIEGEVLDRSATQTRVQTELGLWEAAGPTLPEGRKVWLGFRPRHVHWGAAPSNCFAGTVERVVCLGEYDEWTIRVRDAFPVRIHLQTPGIQITNLLAVTVSVDPSNLVVVPRN